MHASPTLTATTPTRVLLRSWREWRAWPENMAHLWRQSLRFRTVLLTLALTALAIVVACISMALAIQNDLFVSRRDQVLADSWRATQAAQTILDSAETEGNRIAVRNLMRSVSSRIAQQSSSDQFAAFRIDSVPSTIAPQDFITEGMSGEIISDGLREAVETGEGLQWWQSVSIPGETPGSMVPGVIVGQQLAVPGVGTYGLYIAYDLASADRTLTFVQGVLWVVGVALLVIIGTISWFVLRAVTIPIAQAADTSARLAAGQLGVRLEVRGQDELATLGRSFNAMADSIESQIKELAELSLVQQRFVSDVSHELRTPLTTIRLASDMLNDQRDNFDAATGRAVELLHAQVQRFEVLLTDLLEISRYDAGSVQLENEPTSLAYLAEDVIASMHQLSEAHGTEVRLVAPGGYSPVDMDPRRVRRVVRNLLGNAIEHGEGRPIVVTVDSDQRAVALGVRDFGLGMRHGDVERVFDRFWRADPSRKRTIGGTGLGLSIALGDAKLHGGTLAVWSEPGRGTNFVLTIPRHAQPLNGASPIQLDPGVEDGPDRDALGLTQPIGLPEQRELS